MYSSFYCQAIISLHNWQKVSGKATLCVRKHDTCYIILCSQQFVSYIVYFLDLTLHPIIISLWVPSSCCLNIFPLYEQQKVSSIYTFLSAKHFHSQIQSVSGTPICQTSQSLDINTIGSGWSSCFSVLCFILLSTDCKVSVSHRMLTLLDLLTSLGEQCLCIRY